MPYVPEILDESTARAMFIPYLETSDVSSTALLLHIEMIEQYVKQNYFGGGSLSSAAKVPVMLLLMSKIMREPSIVNSKNYSVIQKIGDITFDTAVRGKSPFEQAKSYETMAHEMLKKLAGNRYRAKIISY